MKNNKTSRSRIDNHPLFSLLMDRYGKIMKRNIDAQLRQEKVKLTTPDYEVWIAMNSLIQLVSHVGKLDQCVYYLRSAGKSGRYKKTDQHFTAADWQQYHLGYFYTLYRSIYESALWFVNQALAIGVPPKIGFESKILPKLEKMPELLLNLKALRTQCDKGASHRNDHVHRGENIKAAPLTALGFIDESRHAFSADELIHRVNKSHFPVDARNYIKQQFGIGRRALISALDREIDSTHDLLWKVIDQIESIYREFLTLSSP